MKIIKARLPRFREPIIVENQRSSSARINEVSLNAPIKHVCDPLEQKRARAVQNRRRGKMKDDG